MTPPRPSHHHTHMTSTDEMSNPANAHLGSFGELLDHVRALADDNMCEAQENDNEDAEMEAYATVFACDQLTSFVILNHKTLGDMHRNQHEHALTQPFGD